MYIEKFKKIVIKVGSSTIIDGKGKAKKIWLKNFANDIKMLIKAKKQIVIVEVNQLYIFRKINTINCSGLIRLCISRSPNDNIYANKPI